MQVKYRIRREKVGNVPELRKTLRHSMCQRIAVDDHHVMIILWMTRGCLQLYHSSTVFCIAL
jgi:hypothetical protein